MKILRFGLVASAVVPFLAGLALAETDPQAWLHRMAKAVQTTDYEGTVIRLSDGSAEAVKVAHSVADGVVREKLIAQEGNGLEIIRIGNDVQCILPERKSVLVEEWSDQSTLFSTLPAAELQVGSDYDVRIVNEARVAGRRAMVLAIKPHDEFRYEHRLWLDADTAFPLQTQLIDASGNAIEQVKFADIDLDRDIHASALEPSYSTADYKWYSQPRRTVKPVVDSEWHNDDLPSGFRLVASQRETLPGSGQEVTHLMYSDGLASVSVFIAEDQSDAVAERSQVGASHTYTSVTGGFLVTAVGDVPAATVERIATAMQHRP